MTHTELDLIAPQQLKQQLPLSEELAQKIQQQRQTIKNILNGTDPRLMVIVGPCSIHDVPAALEYAEKLQKLQAQVADQLFLVMRAYIEKPRTTTGWKGFMYDPALDDSADLASGIRQSRQLYLQLVDMGLPIASEILNPMATGYFDDLLAWGAIGARTSESQIHREIASAVPYSMGFKNGTDGSIQIALDAITASSCAHNFLALGQNGRACLMHSNGNVAAHLILRGSNHATNYSRQAIAELQAQTAHPLPALVIDCSHGNSQKKPELQPNVLRQIVAERMFTQVRGVMLESHLVAGQQKISAQRCYGQSITDGCIGWQTTADLLCEMADLQRQLQIKQSA